MTEQISYKFLNKKNLLVLTDKVTHKSFLTFLNGIWSDENNGWIVSKTKEKYLKNFISTLKLQTISGDIRSRKSQKKYHREVSESESSDDYDSDDVKSVKSEKTEKTEKSNSKIEKEALDKRRVDEKTKFEEEKIEFDKKNALKNKYMSEDPMLYYKSFNTQPKNFKKINNFDSENEDDESISVSSSSYSSSDTDDSFPSPRTPKKRRNYNKGVTTENYDDIVGEVKSLSRRIIELELENKKLKSKNK